MNGEQLDKLTGQLYSTTPLIGGLLRGRAARALARDGSFQATRVLAEAVTRSIDEQVRTIALDALSRLFDQLCIDAACEVWESTRHNDLARLLTEGQWVASKPAQLRALTALKAGQLEVVTEGGAEVVELLAQAFEDPDAEIVQLAGLALRKLNRTEAQEELCRVLMEHEYQLAREIAIESQYAPRDAARRAMFYFLTEQWEKYESLDFDQSLLKSAYQDQGDGLRARIATVARKAGRVDWVEVASGGRQGLRLGWMTDSEWQVVLEVLVTNRKWEEMWRLAQEAPPRWSAQILNRMKEVGHVSQREEERAEYEKLARMAEGWEEPDLSSLAYGRATLQGHTSNVYLLAISPDGRVLASGSGDNTVRLWGLPDGEIIKTLQGHSETLWCLEVSPDGHLFASGGDDKTVRLRSLPDGEPIKTLQGHDDIVTCLAMSPDGRVLASGSKDNRVRLWSLPDGKPLKTLQGHNRDVTCLAMSPDGRVLASGSVDNTVRLWSLPDGEPIKTLIGHRAPVLCLAMSPDGRVLASGGWDTTVRLWSMPDGEPFKTLVGHSEKVQDLAMSPDGRVLASGSYDKTVRLWSLLDGEPLKTLQGHSDAVLCLAISPDGRVLASGGAYHDQTVRLWSLPDGKLVQTLKGHGHEVKCLAMSPDGRLLTSGSRDKMVRLWSLLPVRLTYMPISQTNLDDLEWAQNALRDATLSDGQRKALEFAVALMKWQRRFDIMLRSPRRIPVAEFDIEIEE